MRLNVGCGDFYAPGWFNIDTTRNDIIRPDLVVESLLDMPEEIKDVTHVYMGHVLEHMPFEEIPNLLGAIWERCLPGSVFAAVGPDVQRGQVMYDRGEIPKWLLEAMHKTPGDSPWNGHHHLWDCTEDLMVQAVRKSGVLSCDAVSIESHALDSFPVVARSTWQCASSGVIK